MTTLRNKHWVIAILAAAAAVSGCSAASVRLTDESVPRADYSYPKDGFWSRDEAYVARIGLDRHGNLYPDPSARKIVDDELRACGDSVREYFSSRGGYDAEEIATDFAGRINSRCVGSKTLVILIGGIDNTYDEMRRSFLLARTMIGARVRDRELVFLEVYWDGFWGDAPAVWGRARESSKWAGLGLRGVLRRIDLGIPIRVVTHSRGAAVICAALWNVPLREDFESNRLFRERATVALTPNHPGIRLGLLAPAMPEDDFDSYFERTGSPARVHDRVVLGVNENDPALHKGPLGSGAFGSTSLGCHLDLFEPYVGARLNARRRAAFLVDFSGSRIHDFKDYLLRKPFLEEFLPRLFEGEPAAGISASHEATTRGLEE